MKTVFCFFLFLVSINMMGQDEKIFVTSVYDKSDLLIKGHNQMPYNVRVRFELIDVQGLSGNLKPVLIEIPAHDSIVLKKLKAKNKSSFKYKFQKQFPTSVLAKKEVSLKDHPNLKKGIVVFNSDSCPRCHYTLNYLLEHQINFRMLNLKKPENKQLMWKMLRDSGYSQNGVDTPVILVDGKISYNHKHLKEFVKDL